MLTCHVTANIEKSRQGILPRTACGSNRFETGHSGGRFAQGTSSGRSRGFDECADNVRPRACGHPSSGTDHHGSSSGDAGDWALKLLEMIFRSAGMERIWNATKGDDPTQPIAGGGIPQVRGQLDLGTNGDYTDSWGRGAKSHEGNLQLSNGTYVDQDGMHDRHGNYLPMDDARQALLVDANGNQIFMDRSHESLPWEKIQLGDKDARFDTDPGATRIFRFDADGRVISSENPEGRV